MSKNSNIMANFNIECIILGFFLSFIKECISEDTCSFGCGVYTCYTTCENGCCGTYDDRYCCSEYSTVAVVVGSVIGGLILLAIFIGIIAFCIMAIQKKKRMVRPTMVQPTTYNNYTGNSHRNNHQSTRPTATVPPYNQNSQQHGVSPNTHGAQPRGAPPYATGDAPPSYNELYPDISATGQGHSNTNNQRSVPTQQISTIQTSQQYGQLQLPNSPPPPY